MPFPPAEDLDEEQAVATSATQANATTDDVLRYLIFTTLPWVAVDDAHVGFCL
jgi:hypothetical protein